MRRREQCVAVAIFALSASCTASASGDQATPDIQPITMPSTTIGTSTIPLVTSIVESDDASAFTTPGVTPVSSCSFEYTEATLAARSWAFDGTVIAVGNVGDSQLGDVPSATFDVTKWYRGGSTHQVTVQFEMGTISEFVPEVASGTRMLVSGEPRWGGQPLDNAVAWGCGFTQPWTSTAAQQWSEVFGAPVPPSVPAPDISADLEPPLCREFAPLLDGLVEPPLVAVGARTVGSPEVGCEILYAIPPEAAEVIIGRIPQPTSEPNVYLTSQLTGDGDEASVHWDTGSVAYIDPTGLDILNLSTDAHVIVQRVDGSRLYVATYGHDDESVAVGIARALDNRLG